MIANKRKIENLKKALQESQACATLLADRIRTLLQENRGRFSTQLKAAMDKGWVGWATQVAKLHTFHVDLENRRKEGKGFYKLNEESIATVEENLA